LSLPRPPCSFTEAAEWTTGGSSAIAARAGVQGFARTGVAEGDGEEAVGEALPPDPQAGEKRAITSRTRELARGIFCFFYLVRERR
jgi:hypothetical protein